VWQPLQSPLDCSVLIARSFPFAMIFAAMGKLTGPWPTGNEKLPALPSSMVKTLL
jgi:hypothetical protein